MSTSVTGGRLLVVDDDPGMVRALDRVLGRTHEVRSAGTPTAALAAATAFEPELAILDIRMPEMNGFELMRRLRETHAELDVILMTGSAAEPDAHLVRAIDEGAFYFIQKPFDRRVLLTLVGRCLELRRLRDDRQRHQRRIEQELDAARRFQLSLLPPAEARLQGLALCARYRACTELAGDFYDYVPIGDGRTAVLIADVSGHGVSAAMMTGNVKSAFRGAREDGFAPLVVVDRVAESLRAVESSRFVTLWSGVFDRAERTLTYASAGHPPAIIRDDAGGFRRLDSTGPLICSGFRLPWEERTETLASSERILLYTDGVLDVPGADGLFGRDRLEHELERRGDGGAGLLDGILAAVAEHADHRPSTDDITLVTVEWDGETDATTGRGS